MFEFFYYGLPLGGLALALIYGLPAWLVHRNNGVKVRIITNCGGEPHNHWLYDENHIDRPAYLRRETD